MVQDRVVTEIRQEMSDAFDSIHELLTHETGEMRILRDINLAFEIGRLRPIGGVTKLYHKIK